MASSYSDPMTILQILWQALKLPVKAGTLFVPIFLLTLLSSSLLFFSAYSISPVILDLVSKLSPLFSNAIGGPPALPKVDLFLEIRKDLHDIARLASLLALLFFFASLFLMVATTYTFLMAYAGESLSAKQLLLRIARRWYQTLVTRLYVVLLSLGLGLLSSLVIGAVALASETASTSVGAHLVAPAVLLYLYLSTRWAMSLVVTVAEETWGIGALSMSVELFVGNETRGTVLTLVLKAVLAAIYGAFAMAAAAAGPPQPAEEQMKLWLGVAAASAVWDVYATAVYTVFYHECMKSHGLETRKTTVVEWGYIYTSLPAPAAVVVKV
ncbi:hypothetical protein Cni_G15186 [Canna indica]|uniref:Uncharacterized protein n=1 Tax=Canna indica TaxID=4628 RepID=A0AAQ3KHI8_9LILI|nr:hypothetical protein Cni_G15186 [Canna indica]